MRIFASLLPYTIHDSVSVAVVDRLIWSLCVYRCMLKSATYSTIIRALASHTRSSVCLKNFSQQMPSSWPIIIMKHFCAHCLLITLKIHAIQIMDSFFCSAATAAVVAHSFSHKYWLNEGILPINK